MNGNIDKKYTRQYGAMEKSGIYLLRQQILIVFYVVMHNSFSNGPVAVSFTMDVLDEFEANIGTISPELRARRRLFDDYEEEEYTE